MELAGPGYYAGWPEERSRRDICWTSMPRYYFDTRAGEPQTDDVGLEFKTGDEAKAEAIRWLCEMAGERMPRNEGDELAVVVRDDKKRRLFELRLILEISNASQ